MGWYLKLPIKVKLMLSFSLVMLFTLVITVFAVQAIRDAQSIADHIEITLETRNQRVAEMNKATIAVQEQGDLLVKQITDALTNMQLSSLSPNIDSNLRQALERMQAAADNLQLTRYPNEIGIIKSNAEKIIATYNEQIASVVAMGHYPAARSKYQILIPSLFTPIYDNLDLVRTMQLREVLTQAHSIADNSRMYTVIGIAAIALAVSIFIALWSSAYIKRALHIAIDIYAASVQVGGDGVSRCALHMEDAVLHRATYMTLSQTACQCNLLSCIPRYPTRGALCHVQSPHLILLHARFQVSRAPLRSVRLL